MNVQEQQTIRKLLSRIERQTKSKNADNISRTNAYKAFYDRHPEIKWSLLASFVSRNAGWSMTDLKGSLFQLGLRERQQKWFFLAYERANWLIFSDAIRSFFCTTGQKNRETAVPSPACVWRLTFYDGRMGPFLA